MKEYIKSNQEVYDHLAEEYRRKMQDYVISDRKIAAPFIEYIKNHFTKAKVLELGPGSGLNLSYFEKEGFETTAIDFSREILRISQKAAPKTKYLFGDFLAYDFGKSRFEGIFAKAFIHLFPRHDASMVLEKIFDLLDDDGAAFIATTIHEKSEEGFFEKTDYNKKMKRFRKKWTESELLDEITRVGFTVYDQGYHLEHDKEKKWINLVLVKHHS